MGSDVSHDTVVSGLLVRLAAGNRQFVAAVEASLGEDRLERRLARAEPFAVVVGCSDSRVAPEIVFGETLGQLFVVRVAGGIAASAELASVEYAVARWSCPIVVVLGHTECGAVGAALDPPVDEAAPDLGGLAHLASLLVDVRANVAIGGASSCSYVHAGSSAEPSASDDRWQRAVELNTRLVADALRRRSQLLAARVADASLTIVPAVYDVRSGTVRFLDRAVPAAPAHSGVDPAASDSEPGRPQRTRGTEMHRPVRRHRLRRAGRHRASPFAA